MNQTIEELRHYRTEQAKKIVALRKIGLRGRSLRECIGFYKILKPTAKNLYKRACELISFANDYTATPQYWDVTGDGLAEGQADARVYALELFRAWKKCRAEGK